MKIGIMHCLLHMLISPRSLIKDTTDKINRVVAAREYKLWAIEFVDKPWHSIQNTRTVDKLVP